MKGVITSNLWPISPEIKHAAGSGYIDNSDPVQRGALFFSNKGFEEADREKLYVAFARAARRHMPAYITKCFPDVSGNVPHQDNPLFWPAFVHQYPVVSEKVWSLRKHPLTRQRCAENAPREKDIVNRPIAFEFDGISRVDTDEGEYVLAVPFAFAVLRRELHPSSFDFAFTVVTPDDRLIELTYQDLWYECSIVLQAMQGGNPDIEFAVNCPNCEFRGTTCLYERFIEAMSHHVEVPHGLSHDAFHWFRQSSHSWSTYLPEYLNSIQSLMTSDPESDVEFVGARTAIDAAAGSLTATLRKSAEAVDRLPLSLDGPKLEFVKGLREARATKSAASSALRRNTCGGRKATDNRCELYSLCDRWRESTCTRRWTAEELISTGVQGMLDTGLRHKVWNVSLAFARLAGNASSQFMFRGPTGDHKAALGLAWDAHNAEFLLTVVKQRAYDNPRLFSSLYPDDVLRFIASKASPEVVATLKMAIEEAEAEELRAAPPSADTLRNLWATAEIVRAHCGDGGATLLWDISAGYQVDDLTDVDRLQFTLSPRYRGHTRALPVHKVSVTHNMGVGGVVEIVRQKSDWFYYVPE